MKRTFIFLCSAMLIMGTAVAAFAVPVTFTYTADNVINSWYKDGSDPELLGGADNGNWQVATSGIIDLAAGHSWEIIWLAVNNDKVNVPANNPGAFLGQIEFEGKKLLSSSAWQVAFLPIGGTENLEFDGATFSWNLLDWKAATPYAQNKGPGIWHQVNGGPIAGIDGDAWWIWYEKNFAEEGAPDFNDMVFIKATFETAPVPEPATMLLLGSGLIGLAAVGRRRLFNK